MGKEFKKKYMHPTRRKLVDMIQTGEYDKNTTVGWTKKEETRNVGDVWEDEHHRYEKKEGYTLKTSKNSEAFQEIRKYLEEKSKCQNSECKTKKITSRDKKTIENGGFCINCTIEREHEIKTAGIWNEYENYKLWTKMIVYGKAKIESYKQSIDELKPEYYARNDKGEITETWKLPKSIEETKAEIQELIDYGENEIKELEERRQEAFNKIKEKNYEHYI